MCTSMGLRSRACKGMRATTHTHIQLSSHASPIGARCWGARGAVASPNGQQGVQDAAAPQASAANRRKRWPPCVATYAALAKSPLWALDMTKTP
eukprot:7851390-Alexandrium_andersonii.AAC.1